MFATTANFRVTATAFAASMIGTALVVAIPSTVRADVGYARQVERQLAATVQTPSSGSGTVTVAVIVGPNGRVAQAQLARSSGDRALDREAMRAARAIGYPRSDRQRNVAVVLSFGSDRLPSKESSMAVVAPFFRAKPTALARNASVPTAG